MSLQTLQLLQVFMEDPAEPRYGLQLMERTQLKSGTIYPALHRLEKQGWVKSDWRVTEANQRAKFYRLTPKGKKQLLQERDCWSQLVSAIGTILNPKRSRG